jgi:hypothetical protein
MNPLAPVCLFVYIRLEETKQAIDALKNNYLSDKTNLYIFSDGPKNNAALEKVSAVREYINTISGFNKTKIIESEINKGLSESIISGVSKIIDEYGKVIVIEDDLITSRNFLYYMNTALDFYQDTKRVLSISGFSFPIQFPENYAYDTSFGIRASSWGWATWKDRWGEVDWYVSDYNRFKYNIVKRMKFNRGGSDLSHMLSKQMRGKINSWAIRFCYHQFKNDLVDVFPVISKVKNIGFGENAENCDIEIKNNTLDYSDKSKFNFPSHIQLFPNIIRQFRRFNSLTQRFQRKIRRLIKAFKT